MRILDKTISKAPWAHLTPEQRDRLTAAGMLADWMFKQTAILTVVDDDENVQQLDGTLPPVEVIKPTLGERVRGLFTRGEGGE